jgi:hypothetical protein
MAAAANATLAERRGEQIEQPGAACLLGSGRNELVEAESTTLGLRGFLGSQIAVSGDPLEKACVARPTPRLPATFAGPLAFSRIVSSSSSAIACTQQPANQIAAVGLHMPRRGNRSGA